MVPNPDPKNTETVERMTYHFFCDQSGETVRVAPSQLFLHSVAKHSYNVFKVSLNRFILAWERGFQAIEK